MTSESKSLPDVAKESLLDGTWKKWVDFALDEVVAGEQNAKNVLFYSGISTGLSRKLHVFTTARSGRGKTYSMRQLGSMIFLGRFEDVSEMSGRSPYYESEAKNDPDYYFGKILFHDELADASDDTRRVLKKICNYQSGKLTLKTVKDQKFLRVELNSAPVVWTNAMETFEDPGGQLANRLFKVSLDESLKQSQTVEARQKEEELLGVRGESQNIFLARFIVGYILEETGFEVLNPFSGFISQADLSILGRRPMLHALMSSITYCNRFRRPRFELNGKKVLLASISDNLEAIRIWEKNEDSQLTAVPEYLRDVLALFAPDIWQTKEELVDAYQLKYGDKRKPISADTAYQYAHKLEQKDLLTSKRKEGGKEIEWTLLDKSNMSKKSILDFKNFDRESLAKAVSDIFDLTLVSSLKPRETEFEVLIDRLIDCELPTTITQSKIDSP